MGGQISIIKRHNGKITGVSGHTNSFSRVVYDKDFFTDHNNKSLKEYMGSIYTNGNFEDRIELDSYGLFLIDYDNKTIYNNNGYSEYINVFASCLVIDEQDGERSPIRDLFDRDDLCIRSIKSTLIEKGEDEYSNKYKRELSYKNINEMGIKTIEELVEWVDGVDSILNIFKKKKRKGNRFIKKENGVTFFNDIYINIEKFGWKYYGYTEDIDGYINLYNQLIEDGYSITNSEIKQWSDFINEDDETEHTFLSAIQPIIRENTLKELGI